MDPQHELPEPFHKHATLLRPTPAGAACAARAAPTVRISEGGTEPISPR
jgi:hypothetical protein